MDKNTLIRQAEIGRKMLNEKLNGYLWNAEIAVGRLEDVPGLRRRDDLERGIFEKNITDYDGVKETAIEVELDISEYENRVERVIQKYNDIKRKRR